MDFCNSESWSAKFSILSIVPDAASALAMSNTCPKPAARSIISIPPCCFALETLNMDRPFQGTRYPNVTDATAAPLTMVEVKIWNLTPLVKRIAQLVSEMNVDADEGVDEPLVVI